MPTLEVRLFGTPRVELDPVGSLHLPPTSQALLAYLVSQRQHSQPRDVVAAALWGDIDNSHARRCLNTALWRLRRVVEPPGVPRGTFVLSTANGHLVFNDASDHWVDLVAFEQRATSVMDGARVGLDAAGAKQLKDALRLYVGDFLEGVYEDWALNERLRLRDLYEAALAKLIDWYEQSGDAQRAIRYARELLRANPLREEIHRLLMRLHGAAGERSLALRQFETCKRVLAEELDVGPLPETVRLAVRIAQGGEPEQTSRTLDIAAVVAELQRAREQATALSQLIDRSLAALGVDAAD